MPFVDYATLEKAHKEACDRIQGIAKDAPLNHDLAVVKLLAEIAIALRCIESAVDELAIK